MAFVFGNPFQLCTPLDLNSEPHSSRQEQTRNEAMLEKRATSTSSGGRGGLGVGQCFGKIRERRWTDATIVCMYVCMYVCVCGMYVCRYICRNVSMRKCAGM